MGIFRRRRRHPFGHVWAKEFLALPQLNRVVLFAYCIHPACPAYRYAFGASDGLQINFNLDLTPSADVLPPDEEAERQARMGTEKEEAAA